MGPSMFGMLLSCLGGLICFQLCLNFQISWNSLIDKLQNQICRTIGPHLDYSLLLLNTWLIVEIQLASVRGHSKNTFAQDSQIFDLSSPLCVFKHPLRLFCCFGQNSLSPPLPLNFYTCEIQRKESNIRVLVSLIELNVSFKKPHSAIYNGHHW